MKIFLTAIAITILPAFLFAQKTLSTDTSKTNAPAGEQKFNCDSIVVDFETGLLNGKISPSSPIDSIKKYLPCVTVEYPLGSEDKQCGGGVELGKQGIFFNLEHGYIQFASTTTAHLPMKVFGIAEDNLTSVTGDPSEITDLQPYTETPMQSVYQYPKPYGCLAIWVDQKTKVVFKIQIHNKPSGREFLCVE